MIDVTKAFTGLVKLLISGGTIVVWEYGRPIFAKGKGQESSQDVSNRIWAKASELSSPFNYPPSEPSYTTAASWLDNIAFPADSGKELQMIKRDYDKPLSFLVDGYSSVKAECVSIIDPGEKIEIPHYLTSSPVRFFEAVPFPPALTALSASSPDSSEVAL